MSNKDKKKKKGKKTNYINEKCLAYFLKFFYVF